MPGVNYAIHGCSSLSNSRSNTIQEKQCRKDTVAVITQDRVIDDKLKRHIKNRLFLLT